MAAAQQTEETGLPEVLHYQPEALAELVAQEELVAQAGNPDAGERVDAAHASC
jgi:hypothetical protein